MEVSFRANSTAPVGRGESQKKQLSTQSRVREAPVGARRAEGKDSKRRREAAAAAAAEEEEEEDKREMMMRGRVGSPTVTPRVRRASGK
jgi:hypothetical protein